MVITASKFFPLAILRIVQSRMMQNHNKAHATKEFQPPPYSSNATNRQKILKVAHTKKNKKWIGIVYLNPPTECEARLTKWDKK